MREDRKEKPPGSIHQRLWELLRRTLSGWNDHETPRLGAALAFYTVLSLAPLVIVVIVIVGFVLGRSAAQGQVLSQVQSMVGQQGAEAVRSMMTNAQKPASGAIASIFGMITLLFGASGVFGELREALNKIWNVKPANAGGLWGMLKQRFFSFGMVFAVGFLLLVALVVSAFLAALGKYFGGVLPMPEFALSAINFVVSLAGIAVAFALIFRYVPERKIPWRHIWPGASATSLLFVIGKSLIGIYLGKAAVGSAYGAAGSLVVVIVWVYYSSMIFLFGAEFTHVLAQTSEARGEGAVSPASSQTRSRVPART